MIGSAPPVHRSAEALILAVTPSLLSDPRRAADPRSAVELRLRAIVAEQHAFVWRCLRRLGVPESAADDACQHVFLALSKRLGDVPMDKERTFLFGTAIRVAANARRTLARVREEPVPDERFDIASDAPNPEERLSQARRLALLDDVLAALPDELRTVIVLADLEHMSAPEIAHVAEIPVGTVASRLRRARAAFQEEARRVRARLARGGA